MTKKDFEFIAKIISEFEPPFAECNKTNLDDAQQTAFTRLALAEEFARALKNINPLFDKERFMAACLDA